MQSIHSDLVRCQYTRPIAPENRVVNIVKNADQSMTCRQRSGKEFTIPAGEDEMQAFVVFTMMYGDQF